MTHWNNIGDNLWEYRFDIHLPGGVIFPGRTTAVGLNNGDLLLHSPGDMPDEVISELKTLGDLRYLVAPNSFHHMYLAKAAEHFPDAEVWGAPGLQKKRKDVTFHNILTEPTPWESEMPHRFVEGAPLVNESVFFHDASKTLITCDFLFNIIEMKSFMTKAMLFWVGGKGGKLIQSHSWKLFAKDRTKVGAAADDMLRWDFEQLLMGHGERVTENAREGFATATTWMRRSNAIPQLAHE